MESFPTKLRPDDKNILDQLCVEMVVKALRDKLYKRIVKNNEEDFFDLSLFIRAFAFQKEKREKILGIVTPIVMSELQDLGWKCQLAYGDTGLFIYSGQLPKNCYVDDTF